MDAHLEDIIRIRSEVERLHLYGGEKVLIQPLAQLAKIYNGTGPAFLPDSIRGALDKAAKTFLPAIMVHDGDFEDSDGTFKSFKVANLRLLVNCAKCALDAAPWNSLKRYALLGESWTIYRACDRFGWSAWLAAYNKNQTNKEERMRR